MKITIEQGIPIPIKHQFYQELLKMEPGDSFAFPKSAFSNLRGCLMIIRKSHPDRKFKTMRISETERRIWRVK